MSSKYQKPLAIPEGFPALLKGFTREILRAQVCHATVQLRAPGKKMKPLHCFSYLARPPAVLHVCCSRQGLQRTSQQLYCTAAWVDKVDSCPTCVQPDNIYEFGARYFQDLLQNGQTGIDISQALVQNQMQPAQPATGGLDHVSETAAAIDIASLTPAQLEPLVLGERTAHTV